jgi:biotin carboxylase
VRLCLITSKPTDAVQYGFLPAAGRLGLDVVLVTDKPAAYSGNVIGCDVWDFRALVDCVAALAPDAVFTNSDHLQAQTALAAAYLDLPGKDWRSCLRAKNKALMRRRLAQTGTEQAGRGQAGWGPVTAVTITAASSLPPLPFPLVLKPLEGVASEDVVLVHDRAELEQRCAELLPRHRRLLAEQYLPGPLRTMETIGNGRDTWVLGGFRTTLSAPPFFIEESLTWEPLPSYSHQLRCLDDLGVGFGACHTEFAPGGLIEVNDRLIGDRCEFLLSAALGVDLFELTLRVHLGEPLPPMRIPPVQATASYICAERSGVLVSAPAAGPLASAVPGVTVSYWPFAPAGTRIEIANSNRDYLGVLTAFGADAAAVSTAVAAARAQHDWEIRA